MTQLPSILAFSKTATDDNLFKLTTQDFWCSEANIHILTNNALYGDLNNIEAPVNTTDILSYKNFNINDLYFKNATAGNNTKIVAVCIRMPDKLKQELGVFE